MRSPNKKAGVGTVRLFQAQRVRPLPNQPRKRFFGIKELAASIQEIGQTTSGLVTLVEGDKNFDAQLVDGERRLRACQAAGVPFRAEIVADDHPDTIFARSFAANFGKQHHDPIEIAEALKRLIDAGKTQEQIGRLAGHSPFWVSHHLSVFKLHPAIRELLIPQDGAKPKISLSSAVDLLVLPQAAHEKYAAKIAKGLSISQLRHLIDRERRAKNLPRRASTRRSAKSLNRLVINLKFDLSGYCDLPGEEFEALIEPATHAERQNLARHLADLARDATSLAKAIARTCDESKRPNPLRTILDGGPKSTRSGKSFSKSA